MDEEETELRAFHRANPYLDEQAFGLRSTLEALSIYRRFCLLAGANVSNEIEEAGVTIRSALNELQTRQNERCRITMTDHIARIQAGRKA